MVNPALRPHSPRPFLSVIIPIRARRRQLDRLLSSLTVQDCAADLFEVIVVENPRRSNHAWLSNAAWPFALRYHHVLTANRGLARNMGAAMARGSWLFFTDSDVVFTRSTIPTMLAEISNGPTDVIMADVAFPPCEARTLGTHLLDVAAYFRTFRRRRRLGRLTFREFVSCAFVVRHRAFEAVGGFNDGFRQYGYEDVEFALRVQTASLHIGIASAKVYHHKVLGPASVLSQSTDAGRSAVHLVVLHPDIESTMPVGVADTLSGTLAYPPDFDISALIARADQTERQWARKRRAGSFAGARELLDEARDLYWEIARYGRFIGVSDELSTGVGAVT